MCLLIWDWFGISPLRWPSLISIIWYWASSTAVDIHVYPKLPGLGESPAPLIWSSFLFHVVLVGLTEEGLSQTWPVRPSSFSVWPAWLSETSEYDWRWTSEKLPRDFCQEKHSLLWESQAVRTSCCWCCQKPSFKHLKCCHLRLKTGRDEQSWEMGRGPNLAKVCIGKNSFWSSQPRKWTNFFISI